MLLRTPVHGAGRRRCSREDAGSSPPLVGDLGAYQHKEDDDQRKQERVDDGDSPTASLKHALQLRHQGTHQVREKDCEKKRDQSRARNVEEAQYEREQQHRDQNPCRT